MILYDLQTNIILHEFSNKKKLKHFFNPLSN
jgi:hypothetical protein